MEYIMTIAKGCRPHIICAILVKNPCPSS